MDTANLGKLTDQLIDIALEIDVLLKKYAELQEKYQSKGHELIAVLETREPKTYQYTRKGYYVRYEPSEIEDWTAGIEITPVQEV